jgi:hypothetical protein
MTICPFNTKEPDWQWPSALFNTKEPDSQWPSTPFNTKDPDCQRPSVAPNQLCKLCKSDMNICSMSHTKLLDQTDGPVTSAHMQISFDRQLSWQNLSCTLIMHYAVARQNWPNYEHLLHLDESYKGGSKTKQMESRHLLHLHQSYLMVPWHHTIMQIGFDGQLTYQQADGTICHAYLIMQSHDWVIWPTYEHLLQINMYNSNLREPNFEIWK